ncbi:MAG TPA: PEP-CTERM sorting domain-containing protein, partial [Lacipirellulaceae bacterium]|nr:PEP-CTERM sorting domain-containing protein [Lacipirellulaceae bacterium]
PGWVPVGDKVEVYAGVESSDPLGSPTISVLAVQDGTTLTLDPLPVDPLFEGFPFYIYHKFIDLDPALTGSWEITPTDSTGTGLPTFGDAIIEPEFLPLVHDIEVEGTPVSARVTWTPPNLDGFDVDEVAVRVIEATSGRHMWQSEPLPVETTSFELPGEVLDVGVDYVYAVILGDLDGPRYENLSWAFSEPFRNTMPGDFNTDGTVDAADYVVWRKTGGAQDGYNLWRAHFGQTAGSGAAGYGHRGSGPGASAQLISGVPEPSTVVALLAAIQSLAYYRVRQVRQLIG